MFPAFAHFRRTATRDTELERQPIQRGREGGHVVRVVEPRRDALRGPRPLRRDPQPASTRRSAPAAGTSASARRWRGSSCRSCSRRRSRATRRWSSTASRQYVESPFVNQLKTLPVRLKPCGSSPASTRSSSRSRRRARPATSAGWRSSTRRPRPAGRSSCATSRSLIERAPAAAAAAALAAGRGAARARLPVLGRRPRLRPRLPRARARAAARPGNDEQLAEQVARIFSRPLDRARPLWELYLIHGLESGHVGDAHEDPPRGDRRHVGRGDHGPAARPRARGPRAARRRRRRRRATTQPARRSRCSRAGCSACRATRCGCCASLPAALPNIEETPFGDAPGRRHGRAAGRPARSAWSAATAPGPRRRSSRAEDVVQRAHLAAPALRVRPARARRGQGGQERATAARSTTWSSRSARAPCGAG